MLLLLHFVDDSEPPYEYFVKTKAQINDSKQTNKKKNK